MKIQIHWYRPRRAPSTLVTRGPFVVRATPAMSWAVGRRVTSVLGWVDGVDARAVPLDGGHTTTEHEAHWARLACALTEAKIRRIE